MINTAHFKLFSLEVNGEQAKAFISPHVPFDDRDKYLRMRYCNAAKPMSTEIMYNRWLEIMRPELRRGKPQLYRDRVQAFYAICGTNGQRYNATALGTLIQLTEGTIALSNNQLDHITCRYFDTIEPPCLIAIFREIRKDYSNSEFAQFVLSYNDILQILDAAPLKPLIDELKNLKDTS